MTDGVREEYEAIYCTLNLTRKRAFIRVPQPFTYLSNY